MEKLRQHIEDFSETIKGVDMARLAELKKQLYSQPDMLKKYHQFTEWYQLVRNLQPDCQSSRLHHFLMCSSVPEGACRMDDLDGDLSAAAFLEADQEGRQAMIERLRGQIGERRLAA